MNLLIAPVLIISGMLALQANFAGGNILASPEIQIAVPAAEIPVAASTPIQAQVPIISLAEKPYPEPSYVPVMRPYLVNKANDIWYAKDPSSYITPDNEWVKYYASQLYVNYDGRIRYKNKSVPASIDAKGNILSLTDEPFVNNYSFGIYGIFDRDNIPWLMPDYYLTHGRTGVCSAWMATVASLMLSGEMSIKDGDAFTKQVIPVKAVLGYMNGYRDGWVEYNVHGKIFLTSTALVTVGVGELTEKKSATEFVEKKDKTTARPVFEFTDHYFGGYKSWK
ncbi:MAG: hypothetical protein O8C66_03960 [Candidatus Methanoperedens sp.]|nr:hypothetical protein [Candidatus Methanoperedens sp.]MCZ7369642.1 hypothetical protein [Candidatus Methanoperedens sp.]